MLFKFGKYEIFGVINFKEVIFVSTIYDLYFICRFYKIFIIKKRKYYYKYYCLLVVIGVGVVVSYFGWNFVDFLVLYLVINYKYIIEYLD